MEKKKLGWWIVVFLCLGCLADARADADVDTLRQRMIRSYITVHQDDPYVLGRVKFITDHTDGTDVVIRELPEGANDSLTGRWLAGFGADSTWADIDYASQQRGAWPPAYHLQRISEICRSYKTPASPFYGKAEVSRMLHQALNKWFDMALQCPNWWYNEIGGPRFLGPALLMLDQEMTPQERQQGIAYMGQARIGMTGQNRTWLAANVLVRALLERNDSLVQVARDVIASEVALAAPGKEGIQPDGSFHQHGPQQQFGNYGLAYALGVTSWGRLFSGTRFAFSPGQIAVIRKLVVEGISKIIWNGVMDVNSCGRQLFPYTPEGKALALGKVLLDMAVLDRENEAVYRTLYAHLLKGAPAAGLNEGYTHFFSSDMSVMRRSGWMASLRMSSPRTVGAEVVNGENLLSYQMGDGALYLYKTGREYENIFGVFDYTGIPGITTHIPSDTCAVFRNGNHAEFRGGNAFAGGLDLEGHGGVSAMILDREGLQARKSWFFYDDFMICRGTGIAVSQPAVDKPVRTTVAQELLTGAVRWEQRGKHRILRHGDTGYWFPTGNKVNVSAANRTGNWARFATMYAGTPDVEAKVFEVTIDHGFYPLTETYDYVILPRGGDLDPNRAPFHLVNHTDKALGVEWPGRKDIVFFEAGSLRFKDGTEVSVSGPALVSIAPGSRKVLLSDPTQGQAKIDITVKVSRKAGKTSKIWHGIFDTERAAGRTLAQYMNE